MSKCLIFDALIFLGGTILFISWIIQNHSSKKWSEKKSSLEDNIEYMNYHLVIKYEILDFKMRMIHILINISNNNLTTKYFSNASAESLLSYLDMEAEIRDMIEGENNNKTSDIVISEIQEKKLRKEIETADSTQNIAQLMVLNKEITDKIGSLKSLQAKEIEGNLKKLNSRTTFYNNVFFIYIFLAHR